jgi:hypothetical protein
MLCCRAVLAQLCSCILTYSRSLCRRSISSVHLERRHDSLTWSHPSFCRAARLFGGARMQAPQRRTRAADGQLLRALVPSNFELYHPRDGLRTRRGVVSCQSR